MRWKARSRRSRFPAEAARLASSTATLIRETEPDFLRLSNDLKALYAGAAELGRSTADQASSMRAVLGECNLTGANGVANVLLDKLQSELAETGLELNSLAEIGAALRRLLQLGRQIRPIAVFLKTAGYSFRVESARIEETRQAFGAFSEELMALAGRIGVIGDEIENRAEAAHAELAHLVQSIAAGLNQLREIAARTAPIVRETCEETQQLLNSSFAALEQSEARTVEISRHADDAIYNMQFGDIVRQKLEHIAFALEEAAGILAARGKSDDPIPAADRADQILAVQNAQIELVVKEIQSVRDALTQAFAGLRTEGERLAETVRILQDGAPGESSRQDPFEELRKHLLQLEEVTARGASLRDQSQRSWRRAVDASTEVLRCMDEVREINSRMHLQALNAIIKTEWLGDEGRTLRVLSTHMHTMFRESNELVAGTAAVLDTIGHRTVGSPGSAADADAGLESRLAGDLNELYRAQAELQRAIGMSADLSRKQADQLEQAHHNLQFLAVANTRLTALSEGIAALRKEIEPLRAGVGGTGYDSTSAGEIYTMASEHDVHRRMLNQNQGTAHAETAGASPTACSDPENKEDKENKDDNIEFF